MKRMHGYDYDFAARMAAGKQRAQDRRNRGMGTGKGFGTVKRHAAAGPNAGTFERLVEETKCRWECTAGGCREDYLRAVFPERYEAWS